MKNSLFMALTVLCSTIAFCKPLIVGISDSCAADPGPDVRYYVDAVEKAGHVPVVVGFTKDPARLDLVVSRLDALIMTGGEDVAPARYGAKRSPKCCDPNLERDAFEFALVAAARKRRLPIAGICRGQQLVNVAFGGTLYQDLPSEHRPAPPAKPCNHSVGRWDRDATNPPAHVVTFVPGTRWAEIVGAEPLAVNSHHHQAVLKPAPGIKIAATAPDGVVEAIEGTDYPVVGVQFHPEALVSTGATKGFDRRRIMAVVKFLCEH